MSEGIDKTNVLLDEERRLTSHQEVKASIDDDVNARIKQESARVEPKESAEVAGVEAPEPFVGCEAFDADGVRALCRLWKHHRRERPAGTERHAELARELRR